MCQSRAFTRRKCGERAGSVTHTLFKDYLSSSTVIFCEEVRHWYCDKGFHYMSVEKILDRVLQEHEDGLRWININLYLDVQCVCLSISQPGYGYVVEWQINDKGLTL